MKRSNNGRFSPPYWVFYTLAMLIGSTDSQLSARLTLQPEDESTPSADTAEAPTPSSIFPSWPAVELALPERFKVEAEFEQAIASRTADQATGAAQARDPLSRAASLIAAANHLLAYGLESHCSRRLLRLSEVVEVADGSQRAKDMITQAKSWIDQAAQALDDSDAQASQDKPENADPAEVNQEADPVPEQDATRRHVLRDHAETLWAFARAMDAYFAERGRRDGSAEASRLAASGLSPLLESEDHAVATAALFWQSILRSRDDDPESLLSRLDYINAPTGRVVDRYAFWNRIQRCRVLAEHEPKAVALALLLQLEERCFDWFDNESERKVALRSIALVRLQVLRQWYDSLDPVAAADERAWCAEAARRVLKNRFGGESQTVMRLSPTIPIVEQMPAPAPDPGN